MNRGVIVAAASDADFAAEVRDALGTAGIKIATTIGAFDSEVVLLLWSSALPIGNEQLQILIGLWAEGRLTIARRDDAALPLGLGDLDSLPPDAPAGIVAQKFAARIDDSHSRMARRVSAARPNASSISNPPASASVRAGSRGWRVASMPVVLTILVVGSLLAYAQYSRYRGSGDMFPGRTGAHRDDKAASYPASPLPAPAAPSAPHIDVDHPSTGPGSSAAAEPNRSAIVNDKDDAKRRVAELERQVQELRRQQRSEDDAASAASRWFAIWMALAVTATAGVTALGFWVFRRRGSNISGASPPIVPQHDPGSDQADTLFISYARADLQLVEPVLSEIDALGRRVWIDRTEMTGAIGWAGQIVTAIKRSRAVVLMASPRAYASHHVVRELYLAMSNNKTIVPLELEEAELPDEVAYILAPFQRHTLTENRRPILVRALDAV